MTIIDPPLVIAQSPGGNAIWITGSADELECADVILPAWVPAGRKRLAWSDDVPDWYFGWELDDAGQRLHRRTVWQIRLIAGRNVEFCLWAPGAAGAPFEALELHRRSVRARSDAAFQRFMATAIG